MLKLILTILLTVNVLFSFASEQIYLLVQLKSGQVFAGSLANNNKPFAEFIQLKTSVLEDELQELNQYFPSGILKLLLGPTEINLPINYLASIELTEQQELSQYRKSLNRELSINKAETEHFIPFNFENSPIHLGVNFSFSFGPEIWGSGNLNPWLYISPVLFQSGIEVGVELLPSKRLFMGAGIDLNLGGIAYSTNSAFLRYMVLNRKKSNAFIGYTAGLYNPIFGGYNWSGNYHCATILWQFKNPWLVTKNFKTRVSLTTSLQYHSLSTINNDQFISGSYSETFLFPRSSFGILFN